MPTLSLQTPGYRVTLVSERLRVAPHEEKEGFPTTEIPLAEVDRVVVGEGIQITSNVLRELLRRTVPVSFFNRRNQLLGSFEPAGPSQTAARLRQYRATSDRGFALTIARRLVESKVANGRRVLQRLEANHPRLPAEAIARLAGLLSAASRAYPS